MGTGEPDDTVIRTKGLIQEKKNNRGKSSLLISTQI